MTKAPCPVTLRVGPVSTHDVLDVARFHACVKLAPDALAAIKRSRACVEDQLHDGQPHYGINTGFGSLAKQRINRDDLHTLQRNLIRSHTAGVGDPLREELVRAMMFLLAASLARGHSGVRPVVVQTLLAMLNAGVTPVVPSLGSVGASGDLAPLASVALCAIGEGRAVFNGRAMSAKDALKRARIKPLTLEAKEGLALINGTHLMAAEGALLIEDTQMLIGAASLALAMSIDACRASHSFLDARLYRARQQHGPMMEASLLRQHLDGSQIVTSHIDNDPRVQDPYSLRAGPTVLGAAADAVAAIARSIRDELGAVTDNPLVFASESKQGGRAPHSSHAALPPIVSGANFHGMPLALPLDYLAIAIAQIAGISERRTYLMTGAFEPESHLKPFLAPRPGLQSGLMIAQYTAAACVNEIVTLSMPASVANVTTCAGMEDYNSFGPRSAAKARRALELARHVVAIELLCAAQGIECHRPLRSGRNVEHAIKLIRKHVKTLTEDRPLTGDIEAITSMIATGELELGA